MAEETAAVVEDTTATESEVKQPGTEVKLEDVMAEIEKIKAENERLRGTVSSKDKTLAQLKKEKEEIEAKGMSEAEKAIAEAKREKEYALGKTRKIISESLGLDDDTASLLESKDGEELDKKGSILKAYKESVLAEANAKIETLQREIEVLKGNMPNPGKGSGPSGGLSNLSLQELNDIVIREPSRKQEVLSEIDRRNKK